MNRTTRLIRSLTLLAVFFATAHCNLFSTTIKKLRDIVIYEDEKFYCAFPSVIKKPDGEFLLVFRRAPERKIFKENRSNHVDANSYLVKMISKDGYSWEGEPETIFAHPFGGSQDPCLLQLDNGEIICSSYAWTLIKEEGMKRLKQPYLVAAGFTFLGGFLIKSDDGGRSWRGPIIPPSIEPEKNLDAFGDPMPACNRGALIEGSDGRLYWAVIANDDQEVINTSLHLLISEDKGETWQYSCEIARDSVCHFTETSLYETPKGDIIAFMRTAKMENYACIARSTDKGHSFGRWENMGFKGLPLHIVKLPDNRVFLTYGYREKPYGIRAKILNEECTDFTTAPEVILREDGGSWDIGYPWAVVLNENEKRCEVLVTYYFNKEDGLRTIEGTILSVDLKK